MLCGAGLACSTPSVHGADNGNTTFQWQAFVDAYVQSPAPTTGRPVDTRNPNLWSRLQVKHDRLLSEQFRFEGHASLLTTAPNIFQRNATGVNELAPMPARLDLTRLSLRYDGDSTSFLIGKADLSMGVAELYSPVDVFEQFNSSSLMHRYRSGAWQATMAWRASDSDEIKVSLLPFNGRAAVLPEDSRWRTAVGTDPIFDIAAATREQYASTNAVNTGKLVRYSATREGYDWFLGAYQGRAPYVNLRRTITLTGVFPLITTSVNTAYVVPRSHAVFGGITRTAGSLGMYGEAIYQRTKGGQDENYLRYVVGITYRETQFANRMGWEEITPVLEYAGEKADGAQDVTLYPATSAATRPYRNALLARLKFKLDANWKTFVGMSRNVHSHDWVGMAGFESRFSDDLSFFGQATFLGGAEGTQFGRWRRNDNLSLGFDFRF